MPFACGIPHPPPFILTHFLLNFLNPNYRVWNLRLFSKMNLFINFSLYTHPHNLTKKKTSLIENFSYHFLSTSYPTFQYLQTSRLPTHYILRHILLELSNFWSLVLLPTTSVTVSPLLLPISDKATLKTYRVII